MKRNRIIISLIIILAVFFAVLIFRPFQIIEAENIEDSSFTAYYNYPSDQKLTEEEFAEIKTLLQELTVRRHMINPLAWDIVGGYQSTPDTLEVDFLYYTGDRDEDHRVYHVTIIPGGRCWIYDTDSQGEWFEYDILNPEELISWAQEHYDEDSKNKQ